VLSLNVKLCKGSRNIIIQIKAIKIKQILIIPLSDHVEVHVVLRARAALNHSFMFNNSSPLSSWIKLVSVTNTRANSILCTPRKNGWTYQAPGVVYLRSSAFLDFMRLRLTAGYSRFATTYRSQFQESSSSKKLQIKRHCLTFEHGTNRLYRNVGNQLPTYAV
jgi:hypothetical protein